jgi:hypothetical protein
MGKELSKKCGPGTYCEALRKAINGTHLISQSIVDIPTGKVKGSFPVLKTGELRPHGVFLNCCPFCAFSFKAELEKVRKQFAKTEKASKKKAVAGAQ